MILRRNILIFIGLFLIFNFYPLTEASYGSAIKTDDYSISTNSLNRTIGHGTILEDFIEINNLKQTGITISFSFSGDIGQVIDKYDVGFSISSENKSLFYFTIVGKDVGVYNGLLEIKGDIIEKIPINVNVVEEEITSPFLMEIKPIKTSFVKGALFQFNLKINKLKKEAIENVSFTYSMQDSLNNSFPLKTETINVTNSFQILKTFSFPDEINFGDCILKVVLESDSFVIENKAGFVLKKHFWQILLFGVLPLWVLILIAGIFILGFLIFYFIKRHIESKKKYKMVLDLKTLPKKEDGFLHLGNIAEKKVSSYLDPARLTTHTIVAGATGGGKSISAQVIIEEALMNNIAVIVFDPTAQWSGMLRKCTDKKMMSYYPKFGLKETDARAFKGNVRQVTHARELIDINKYVSPGQIQIFSLNKLDPKDMDIFVSNVIRQVFKSDPKESPVLKVLLVFDEVHRLLSKFGGSGQGFLQVERACREFRKWGLGMMLISQVLNDFVGEIKANINTEVQTRTLEEGDLERIKTKYGEGFLKSLIRAEVGVAMFQNAEYNRGRPYFINFRPILHNTRRLPDEELEKYNKYNDIVDDLEFSIDALEREKQDVFDLRMELKLVKDKVMSGNFSVVEIYLEGLKPRVEKAWETLGKTPPKREIKLVSEDEIKKSVKEAQESRKEFEKKEKASEVAEKVVQKKEDILKKEVAALTFDNGIMVSSAAELLGALPTMDEEVFRIHVNENKNDIAQWVEKNLSKDEGEKLKSILDKQRMITALGKLGKREEKFSSGKKENPQNKENKGKSKE
ncbi:MAG: DUF87 domain-containing protein [Candidatus Pacearchaeota archaeon]|jgi:hypothetical protein